MTLHEFPEIEQRSDSWFEQRRGIVTASVVGQLITGKTLAVADNDVSRGLTALLVAERITGQSDPTFISEDMWRGIEHEPYAVAKYAEHYAPVKTTGFMVRDDWGFKIGASPDGLVGDDGGLEVKCPRAKTHIRTILADEVPTQHVAQVQTCLLVSGRRWWDYVSFCAGLPLWTKRVHPEPAWHEAIVSAVAAFENNAARMVDDYRARTQDLPATERLDLEIAI